MNPLRAHRSVAFPTRGITQYTGLCVWLLLSLIMLSSFIPFITCTRAALYFIICMAHMFLNPFISRWTHGFFLPSGYCDLCPYGHVCIRICLNTLFPGLLGPHPGTELLGHMVTLGLTCWGAMMKP